MLCDPQQFMSWFGHRGCLAGHQTTWVDLPCCYWLNLKLQVDFTSLAIHTKLYILGAENAVWWVTRSKSKVSRPLFSLVLVAGDMICFVVKSENLMKRGLWSRLNLDLLNIFPIIDSQTMTDKIHHFLSHTCKTNIEFINYLTLSYKSLIYFLG